MNKLSAKQISNIEKAVNKATDIVFDEGLSPSAAIAKTASVMKLSSDYLPIIIHAFNNGAAEVHRKEASTIQEKAADYPIAIQSEVYRLLGAPLEKKASAPVVEDTFYNMPLSHTCPDAWSHLDKYKYRQATDWDDIKPVKIKSASDRSDHHRNAVNDIAIAVADEVTRIKYAAQDAYEKAYTELETEMRKYGGVPLETAVMHAKAAHGNTGVSLVMTVIKNNNLEKNAGFRKDVFMTTDHPFAKKLKDLVFKNEQLKEAKAQEQRELKKCAEAMTALLPEKRKPIEGMDVFDTMFKEGTLNRKKKEYQRSVRARSEELQKRAYTPTSVNPLTGASGLDSLIHPAWSGLDPFERDLMYGLADPLHEGKLRQIRMQSILTDLMSTDPYLKEKDPEEVLDAVNEILELNKELHNNKPMLRVALRQYLESGGLDIPTLGIINDYGAKEKDRDAKERASRESAAIQQMSESTRLRDSQLTRELQKSQKLDDYLATAIQSGKARDTQKSIAKKDRLNAIKIQEMRNNAEKGKPAPVTNQIDNRSYVTNDSHNLSKTDSRDYSKTDSRDYSKTDSRDYSKTDSRDYSKTDSRDYSKTDSRNYSRSDSRNYSRSDSRNFSTTDSRSYSADLSRTSTKSDNREMYFDKSRTDRRTGDMPYTTNNVAPAPPPVQTPAGVGEGSNEKEQH